MAANLVRYDVDDRSGGDLEAFADEGPVIEKYAGLDRFPRLYQLLGKLGKPTLCAANGDVLAGVAAFREKREPRWQGRYGAGGSDFSLFGLTYSIIGGRARW